MILTSSDLADHLFFVEISGKNNFTWTSECVSRSRTRNRNHTTEDQKIADVCFGLTEPIQFLRLFFDREMKDLILLHTNREIRLQREHYQSHQYFLHELDEDELDAFCGLVFLVGVIKLHHQNLGDLWTDGPLSPPIFRLTMNLNRFCFLCACLRFDDRSLRFGNRLAPIEKIWNIFDENCRRYYQPSQYMTIDEMLRPFRGRCIFRQYIPSKPAKYGVKIFILSDALTPFCYKSIIYSGKSDQRDRFKPENITLELAQCISGTGRNFALDNWFTSIPLAKKLLDQQLTLLGTLKKNKTEIPPEFLPSKDKQVNSTIFGFNEELTLCSFVPKPRKARIRLSTMHDNK